MVDDESHAWRYARAVSAGLVSSVDAEPEAQLTVPVAVLLESLASDHELGTLQLVREVRLDGIRPDYAVLLDGRACGWMELKAPGHSLDGASWTGREKKQWGLLAELDALIVSDGRWAVLYSSGERVGGAQVPYDGPDGWDAGSLVDLLRRLAACRPATITRPSQLAARLAPLTRMLRDRVAAGLVEATLCLPVQHAKASWTRYVHEHVTDDDFADDLAQVIAYSLAIAALRGGADANGDHLITLSEARASLADSNAVLAAALGPVIGIDGLARALAPEVGAIERLVSAVDPRRIARSRDSRGEPWLWFYEDFLETYDPERRKQAGVYYTPTAVVGLQVRLVDHVLRQRLDRPLGFGAKDVVTLDPATGSGTYPLAVLDRASEVAEEVRGAAGPAQVAAALTDNLMAFELLPGPFAVAQLRIGQRLAEMRGHLIAPPHVRVYLTDTLEDPDTSPTALDLWGDVAVLTREREKAAAVKSTQPVTVILGNPPYKRRTSASGGGWVLHPASGRALFEDVLQAPKDAGVIFSAQASLFNDYLYFWRWALHKAFEQRPDEPAVVSFVTASSWLDGPAFLGLRALARELADEVWVVDLGGEGRGANGEDNVFAIQTPVAVVTLHRRGKHSPGPAVVHYRRVRGTRAEKFDALTRIGAPGVDDGWQVLPGAAGERLAPVAGGEDWQDMPALTDLLPWQQPGCKFGRTWPIAPTPDLLHKRWNALLVRSTADERAAAYVTAATGRTIRTRVGDLTPLADLRPGAPPQPAVRYGYRSFDRQWTLRDPRLAALERPALWASLSERQVFLSTMTTTPLGAGPALTVSTAVPDLHHFRGSFGGKDVLPLYRDAAAQHPNLPAGLLDALTGRYGAAVTAEDVVAYVVALLAHPGYQERFAVELATPGPRVPLTADAQLFVRATALGRNLLWVQTFAERFRDEAEGRGAVLPAVAGLGWSTPVGAIPATTRDITFDASRHELHLGTGTVTGVKESVWAFSVSGLPVLERWLGSRTATGIGRAATRPQPLDVIRPSEWSDEWNDELLDLVRLLTATVEMQPEQDALLGDVLAGPMIPASELPEPSTAERGVPGGSR